jgi:hypothetical protein
LGVKVDAWLAASPRTEEEIVGFINSIPWWVCFPFCLSMA